jgi:NADH-quinone oxidoreductase subunit E
MMEIPPELAARIDEIISHYPVSKRSASLPLLHLFQEHLGYITDDAILEIARRLDLEPINILELVTFYPMFRREPVGRCHVRVCRTLSCAMAGGYELLEAFCKHADIQPHPEGQGGHLLKSADGRYSVEFVECLASCGTGPVCMIEDDFYEAVSLAEVPQLLQKYA